MDTGTENGLLLIVLVDGLAQFVATQNDVEVFLKIIVNQPWRLIKTQMICEHQKLSVIARTNGGGNYIAWYRCEFCKQMLRRKIRA
jgi:hypothetical protein